MNTPSGGRDVDGLAIRDLAGRLVAARSENPPGATSAACDIVTEQLEASGFTVRRYEPEPGFESVLGEYRFAEDGPTLMLNGHVDVVPAGDETAWTRDPWGEVDGDLLYGRGSLDMKGPLAALVVAARHAVDHTWPLRGRLLVAAVADEESGGRRGSGALVAAGAADADAVLIAEPGDGGVVVAHRGMCFVALETHGVSAHASMPSKGVNAVEQMIDVLGACRDFMPRHDPHPLLGSPTIAVGTTISGGQKVNMIPDRCRATLDVRLVPGMTASAVVEDLRRHLQARGVAPEIEIVFGGEAGETSPDSDIVRLAAAAYEAEFGEPPPIQGMPAATDGWWFTNRAGAPTVMGLAPGGIDGCHIIDECVDLSELERYGRIYADVIRRYLSGD